MFAGVETAKKPNETAKKPDETAKKIKNAKCEDWNGEQQLETAIF